MATIYDVAQKAGVSPKTVSRVLNEDAPVGEKTRQHVKAAIAELGYIPSSAARAMRSNKSGLVGLITGAISGGTLPGKPAGLPELHIVQGIQSVISASSKTLMIADTMGDAERVTQLMQTFLEHRVEGLFYVADHHTLIRLPITARSPMVLVNAHDNGQSHAVLPDDERGQFELVTALINAGHKRIAYLTLKADSIATILRTRGYRAALENAGIAYDPELVAMAHFEHAEGTSQLLWDTIDQLLSHSQAPSVICCGNDEMAFRVYETLRARGVTIPDDVSVAGYDNHRAIAETLSPQLTTVELPYWAMGAKAANAMLELISGKTIDRTTPLKVSGPVHWRSSVIAKAAPVIQFNTQRRKIP